MASLEDPRRYEAEDEDFLDREETYVMQKSTNKFVSDVTAKNRQQKAPENGFSAPKSPEPAPPKKASKFGIVAQAVKKLEATATLTSPPPALQQQVAPAKKEKRDKKRNKGKQSHLASISERDSDEESLGMHDIFPEAFDKNGASKADLNESKIGSKRALYLPVVQQPWNEKSVMKFHESTIGATNVGTQYMKDIKFDDDDHSLDIGEVFPVLSGDKAAPSKPTSKRPPPAPPRMAARVAAVKRTEAARKNGKVQVAVAAAPQKPPESKERSNPPQTHVHRNHRVDASNELTMDTALKQPDDDAKRVSLERKKSKKVKKTSRKKSHRHLHEDEDDSVEDSDARRERRRRKKEKKAAYDEDLVEDSEARRERRRRKKEKKAAKKELTKMTEGSHDEKSRKKSHKKHKKRSTSERHIPTDGHAHHVRNNQSMPEMHARNDAALDQYLRARASKEPNRSSTKSSTISAPERSRDPRSDLDHYIRAASAATLQSDSHTTVKKSNVHSSGKALKPLSDPARSRKPHAEPHTDTGLSDSSRSRKARTERNDEMSDSHKFRKALQASRKAAADARNDTLRPLSPRKESPNKYTSSTLGSSLLPSGRPQPRPNKKVRNESLVEMNSQMESIGKFDVLDVADAAVKTKKVGKRTSGGETKTSGMKPSAPPSAAVAAADAAAGGTKKKTSRNIFKSLLLFSRKSESNEEGAEERHQKYGLFVGSKAKRKADRAQSAPPRVVVDRGAQNELNEYLHNSKTDSKTSWNDSIEEENKLLHSPAKPALDFGDFSHVLGTPPGEKLGTTPLLHRDYSGRRRRRKSP